jgi:hypothetical protein
MTYSYQSQKLKKSYFTTAVEGKCVWGISDQTSNQWKCQKTFFCIQHRQAHSEFVSRILITIIIISLRNILGAQISVYEYDRACFAIVISFFVS